MNNTETTQALIDAIKDATASRAELFARGNWTAEEMDKANKRIAQATDNYRKCCANN